MVETGGRGSVTTVWDTAEPMPTEAKPQLAVVLQPRDPSPDDTGPGSTGETPEAWVFPFDRPLQPEPGDNQARAVNTEDGTVVYDVAIAMVWVEDGDNALNANEAYAFASSDTCAAVSVAFQVVFVPMDTDVIAPQNIAAAVNYDCVNCLTYALAQQLVVTLAGPLSEESMQQLDAIWAELAQLGAEIASIPLDEIDDRLDEIEVQILLVIEADQPGTLPSAPASASESASPDGSTSESPSPGASPSADTESDGTTSWPSPPASTSPSPVTSPSESPSPSPTPTSSPTG
jgi:putative peptide zinc metalloprotease protein